MGDAEFGEAVVTEAVEAYQQAFGNRLVAAYALGSLAHGGFSSLVSDVDLGLVLDDPLGPGDDGAIQVVADGVKEGASSLHSRLSVFWGTPSTLSGEVDGGRFPPLDRLDLLEHGRLIFGRDVRSIAARPDRSELLVVGAEFALDFLAGGRGSPEASSGRLGSMAAGEDAVKEIRQPELLVVRGSRRVTKIVLFPVRFLFTAATGRVGTNDLAVEHYLADLDAPGKSLVRAALGWRTKPPGGEAIELLRRDLIALYVYYIDDHVERLLGSGRPDLAEAFRSWRGRILA